MDTDPLFEKPEENLDFAQLQKWGEQKTLEKRKQERKLYYNNSTFIIEEERLRYLSEN